MQSTGDGSFDIEIQNIQDDKIYPESYQQDRKDWLRQLTGPPP